MGLAAFNRMRRIAAEQAAEQEQKPAVDDELQALRDRGVELGIPQAARMGQAKLLQRTAEKEAEIAEKERAEAELQKAELAKTALMLLRIQATDLGIEGAEEKDAETLEIEIKALIEQGEGKGGE